MVIVHTADGHRTATEEKTDVETSLFPLTFLGNILRFLMISSSRQICLRKSRVRNVLHVATRFFSRAWRLRAEVCAVGFARRDFPRARRGARFVWKHRQKTEVPHFSTAAGRAVRKRTSMEGLFFRTFVIKVIRLCSRMCVLRSGAKLLPWE